MTAGQPVPRSAAGGVVWPAVPGRVAASALALQFQLDRSQWWAPAEIAAHQAVQLAALLDHALARVPWYRDRVRDRHAPSPRPGAPVDFAAFTPLAPADVRAAARALHADSVPPQHGRLHRAVGACGASKIESDLERFFQAGLVLRDHRWHDRDWTAPAAVVTDADREAPVAWGAAVEAVWDPAPVARLPAADFDHAWREIARLRPGRIFVRARAVGGLASAAAAAGPLGADLAEVCAVGGPLGQAESRAAEAAFRAPVRHRYEVPGVGCIALPCPDGHGWHVQAEVVLAEVVDADGNPCAPGRLGRLLLTPLHAFGTPLIRYAPGDMAEPAAPCPCGRGLARLARIVAGPAEAAS